jgi:hypothetical protein
MSERVLESFESISRISPTFTFPMPFLASSRGPGQALPLASIVLAALMVLKSKSDIISSFFKAFYFSRPKHLFNASEFLQHAEKHLNLAADLLLRRNMEWWNIGKMGFKAEKRLFI